ncbi:TfoX/Sxy family protein [Phaeovulum vinaykumarii]|uniref:Transcriptional regulator of competence genes, TfoX/Sxy family n=1 Tax=Phaeovulum vinaykumarii TaxID=407234 RepID=A0A1N7MA25_9RHOB|nr:TfoX/Sxy family protein [Phaeovulum vinaykumarii]SIS82903.1 Transcriptional regulator of competence genes, TfoX/Sxy family [Phaeovulum vinaykumarii]SOC10568.1 TfoX/Sxy family transcriptional regulator of competence genes [Phaeovulum vinaykumarii]
MATRPETADFLLECLDGAGVEIRLRRMFGEYCVYADDKVAALLCDDALFVKPVPEARAYLGSVTEAPPYDGAKPHFRLDPDTWEDRDRLGGLMRLLAQVLPAPKPRKPRTAKTRPQRTASSGPGGKPRRSR